MSTDNLHILVVDEDPTHGELIRYAFEEAGSRTRVSTTTTLEGYRHRITDEPPDMVLMDLNLPDGQALEALEGAAAERGFPVLIMTAGENREQAVSAIKAGALDYLVKSEETFAQMPLTVERVLREWRLWRERHHLTVALTQSEERYRSLYHHFSMVFDGVPDPLLLVDNDMRIEWINRAALAMFGGQIAEGRKTSFWQLLERKFFLNDLNLPKPRDIVSGAIEKLQLYGQDGKSWNMRTLPVCETDEETKRILILFHAVDEKMKNQSDAVRTSPLAVLGELAAGVAHEINNPINGIINYAQILVNRLSSDQHNTDIARRIIHEGNRIATIVGNLLAFARPQEEQHQRVCLNEALSDSLTLAAAQLRQDNISLQIQMPDNLPFVQGVKSQLQQVFLNLISNSRYALNEKYPVSHPDKSININGQTVENPDGKWVRLTFRDYGTGITKAHLMQVLHPFFTTKPVNSGTGLGLSISHGIIKNHCGRLDINSIYGQSTVVTIDLPLFATKRGCDDSENSGCG